MYENLGICEDEMCNIGNSLILCNKYQIFNKIASIKKHW